MTAWELREQQQILCGILHTDATTVAWSFGLRNLILPGEFVPIAGQPYDMARNSLCSMVLNGSWEWAGFLDSDVIPPRDAFPRLLSHRLPIVSGVYARRSPPHSIPVMLKRKSPNTPPQWVQPHELPASGLLEVDLVGAGCMVIHRSVLEKLPPLEPGHPWFCWRVDRQGILPPGECLSEDFAFCFPAGSWVIGDQSRKIEDVVAGDRVLTHAGSIRKVLSTSQRTYTGELVSITSYFAGRVDATPGHKFLVRTKVATGRKAILHQRSSIGGSVILAKEVDVFTKKTMWKEAKDIQPGDWLYIPKIKMAKAKGVHRVPLRHIMDISDMREFKGRTLGYSKTRKDALRISRCLKVTPSLCRLLGYYIAEGWSGKKDHYVCAAFNENEPHYVADFQQLLKECFGADSKTRTKNGCTKVWTSSKVLGKMFSALCGKGASGKHLPLFWNQLNTECLTELIKGYWNGDGTCSRNNFSMSTRSERLAREVQASLLKLGVLVGLRSALNCGTIAYCLQTPSVLAERFSKLVDYPAYDVRPIREKNGFFKETKTHFLVAVSKVDSRPFEGEVFNLSVAGKESYTANAVAVHNCKHAQQHGYKIMVDCSIRCKHVGNCESDVGTFLPCETRVHTDFAVERAHALIRKW